MNGSRTNSSPPGSLFTWVFIAGLVVSGATAIPLNWELDLLAKWFGLEGQTSATATSELGRWLLSAREALQDVNAKHPLLFYSIEPIGSNVIPAGRSYFSGMATVMRLETPVPRGPRGVGRTAYTR
jgi:hypothetical protein